MTTTKEDSCKNREAVRRQLQVSRDIIASVTKSLDKAAENLDSEMTPTYVDQARREVEQMYERLGHLFEETRRHQSLAWRAREFIKKNTKLLPDSPEYLSTLDNLIDELAHGNGR